MPRTCCGCCQCENTEPFTTNMKTLTIQPRELPKKPAHREFKVEEPEVKIEEPINLKMDHFVHGPWKLTLPRFEEGSTTRPLEIKQPELKEFSDEDYFKITDTGIIMTAPVDGSRTKNTKYPRCEFREMNRDGSRASWDCDKGSHNMQYRFEVLQLPEKKPEVCVCQIHDGSDDIWELRAEGDKLIIQGDPLKHLYTKSEDYVFCCPLKLGKTYSVIVSIDNCTCSISVDMMMVNFKMKNTECYFKAGCYTQANLTNSTPGSAGSVKICYLKANHFY